MARAEKKWNQLDLDHNGALEGDELLKLAEWVWTSFHPDGEAVSEDQKQDEASKLLRRLDSNKDGKLVFEEFGSWFRGMCTRIAKYRRSRAHKARIQKANSSQASPRQSAPENASIKAALDRAKRKFRELDTNKDGLLQQEEVMQLAEWVLGNFHLDGQPLSEAQKAVETEKIMQAADQNHDGMLDFAEFSGWFERTCVLISQFKMLEQHAESREVHSPLPAPPRPRASPAASPRLTALQSPGKGTTPEMATLLAHARQRFDQLDTDCDGSLYGDEVMELSDWVWGSFHPGGEPLSDQRRADEALQLVARVDKNQDGKIDFDEFARWFIGTSTRIEAARKQSPVKSQRQQLKHRAMAMLEAEQHAAPKAVSKQSEAELHVKRLQEIQQSNEDAIAETLSDILQGKQEQEAESASMASERSQPKQEFEELEDAATQARDAFRLFDHGNKGHLTAEELALAMRWLGVHPTQLACSVIARSLQCDQKQCTEHVFVGSMVPHPPCAALDEVEVANAWREFDVDNCGELPESEVLTILTSLGEQLTISEARAVLQSGNFRGTEAGMVDYIKLSKFLVSKTISAWAMN